METRTVKEGFLQKAGKSKFQPWRKRWFILTEDSLTYHEPNDDYDANKCLGSLQLVEMQSVILAKSPKFAFDIVSRGRTYSVAAKSDVERDEWIIALRRAAAGKRNVGSSGGFQLAVNDEEASATSTSSEAGSWSNERKSSADSGSPPKSKMKLWKGSQSMDDPIQAKPKGKQTGRRSITKLMKRIGSIDDPGASMVISGPIIAEQAMLKDQSTSSLSVVDHDDVDVESNRSVKSNLEPLKYESEDDVESLQASSALRKMSKHDDDLASADDTSDDECQRFSDIAGFSLPPPRGASYALDELRDMVAGYRLSGDDLKELARKTTTCYEESSEFPALAFLKSYMASVRN